MTSVSLWFPLTDVLGLAEHAMNAPDHRHAPSDESATGTPSLIWVRDNGIYLVSNGLPRQAPTDTDPPDNIVHVVYAHGHGDGTHWHHGPPLGDDFIEYLPLTGSSAEPGTPLIDMLRDAGTAAWLVITVDPNTFSIVLTDTGPS
ncbi:hypothetical protein [Nocardia asiatica]